MFIYKPILTCYKETILAVLSHIIWEHLLRVGVPFCLDKVLIQIRNRQIRFQDYKSEQEVSASFLGLDTSILSDKDIF